MSDRDTAGRAGAGGAAARASSAAAGERPSARAAGARARARPGRQAGRCGAAERPPSAASSCRTRSASPPASTRMPKRLPGVRAGGFSWVEIGTVTPRPQAGNPRPRLFRLRDRTGADQPDGLQQRRARGGADAARGAGARAGVLGANIGANRTAADPVADYVTCLRALYPLVDYVTINVSSPNTPGLRDLQHRDRLSGLLGALLEARARRSPQGRAAKPLLLKIAPDLAPEDEADDRGGRAGAWPRRPDRRNTTVDRAGGRHEPPSRRGRRPQRRAAVPAPRPSSSAGSSA